MRIGFARLRARLARRKGARDPGAVAASIGRKKYGTAEMERKAEIGRRRAAAKKRKAKRRRSKDGRRHNRRSNHR